jgi:hypothetical protein
LIRSLVKQGRAGGGQLKVAVFVSGEAQTQNPCIPFVIAMAAGPWQSSNGFLVCLGVPGSRSAAWIATARSPSNDEVGGQASALRLEGVLLRF